MVETPNASSVIQSPKSAYITIIACDSRMESCMSRSMKTSITIVATMRNAIIGTICVKLIEIDPTIITSRDPAAHLIDPDNGDYLWLIE